jgi:hypothetical protein
MLKLKLEVEQLAVESFGVQAEVLGRGTVDAHISSNDTLCDLMTCAGGCTLIGQP